MKDKLLDKIREEADQNIDEYMKAKRLAFVLGEDTSRFEKPDEQIIMAVYRKHISEIEPEDTAKIYYYDGTYKYVLEEVGYSPAPDGNGVFVGAPVGEALYIMKEVPRDDPEAEERCYSNVEGIDTYMLSLEDADEFEKTHTVIYDDAARDYHRFNSWDAETNVTYDFVTTAYLEGQKLARRLILEKYNTKRPYK